MSCLWTPLVDSLMATWVSLAEGLTLSRGDTNAVQNAISRSRTLQDLECKQRSLEATEAKMDQEMESLLAQAREKKRRNDVSGARQKLVERRSLASQLERLRSSQHIIAMHLGTMKGAELNQALISTLKASNLAIRSLDPGSEITQIEDFMYDLEDGVKKTSQISDVLAKPMASSSCMDYGAGDLERELDELLLEPGEGGRAALGSEAQLAVFAGHAGARAPDGGGKPPLHPLITPPPRREPAATRQPRLEEFAQPSRVEMV